MYKIKHPVKRAAFKGTDYTVEEIVTSAIDIAKTVVSGKDKPLSLLIWDLRESSKAVRRITV